MIYVCIPSRDEGETIGLVLWKVRKAFEALGREYHVLVGNDGSSDHTAEVLDTYAQVLPLTIRADRTSQGYAATVEALLRQALELSDRHKRDGAILMHADFAHGPEFLGDFARKLDSGADLVVGEGTIDPQWDRWYRWTRRWSAYLLSRSAGVEGVLDPTSGYIGFRLAALKSVFNRPDRVFVSEGWAANAELVGRAAVHARRIDTVSFAERHDLKGRETRIEPWPTARELWASSHAVRKAVAAERAAPRSKRREKGNEA